MATINPDLSGIVDGAVGDAADWTTPFRTIINEINGGLDSDNLEDKAVSSTKFGLVGQIAMYGSSTAPDGWLGCDGSAVSRTTYSALFAVIGTTYGTGDGSSTFNLPDFRGRAPIGNGTGSGLTARSMGATVGAETHTLQTSEMPSHTHTQDAHSHGLAQLDGVTNAIFQSGGSTDAIVPYNGALGLADVLAPNQSTNNATATNQNTGGGGAHANMQPSLVCAFIIKY